MEAKYSNFKRFIEINSDLRGDALEAYARRTWNEWLSEMDSAEKKKMTYADKKEQLRQEAINYQLSEEPMYLSEIAERTAYFAKMGKRYGLLKEFRENGII